MKRSVALLDCSLVLIVVNLLSPLPFNPVHAEAVAPPKLVSPVIGWKFPTEDTLNVAGEISEDAKKCLEGLSWRPTQFDVLVGPPMNTTREDAMVRFPSPVSSKNHSAATVVMEWFMPRDEAGAPRTAPAVIVVHESGRKMPVGRLIAQGFKQRGIHAFMVQMPGYGERSASASIPIGSRLDDIRQGIADVRRAHDAVAALPFIQKDKISLQGTSLGGFIAGTTAGLDGAFDKVFILLAGGNVYDVLQNGDREAAQFRETLYKAGITDEAIRELAWKVEPSRLAHRLSPERTWLYSGVFDQVVPIENGRHFARVANLPDSNFIQMPVDHYAGLLILSGILDQISTEILREQTAQLTPKVTPKPIPESPAKTVPVKK